MAGRKRERKGWPIWRPLTALLCAVVGGLIGAFCLLRQPPIVDAEAPYDGVHLCSPHQKATATAAGSASGTTVADALAVAASARPETATLTPDATVSALAPPPSGAGASGGDGVSLGVGTPVLAVAPSPTAIAGQPGAPADLLSLLEREAAGDQAPFFSQISDAWGQDAYAKPRPGSSDFDCGKDIKHCGCAMTSVATVLSMFKIVTTADGEDFTPSTLNSWFNGDAQLTDAGWVSQGYVYGNVVWTAANAFSADVAAARPGTTTVRFNGWLAPDVDAIRAEIQAGRPVVMEVPGHFIAGVGIDPVVAPSEDGSDILINDPYYRSRVRLSSYAGRIRHVLRFESSQELGAILISVPANVRVRVRDTQGRETGTLTGGKPGDVASEAKQDIPGSQYVYESAWRDPTCTERAPAADAGVNHILIPNPSGGYQIEVTNPSGGDTHVAVHTTDATGHTTIEAHDEHGNQHFVLSGPTVRSARATPTPTVTPPAVSPSSTVVPPIAAAPTAALPTPVPPTVPPTTVPTPTVPQGLPTNGTADPDPACAAMWLQLSNRYRATRGLPAWVPNAGLQSAAAEYARFDVEYDWHDTQQAHSYADWPHVDSLGRDQSERAWQHGAPRTGTAENVRWGTFPVNTLFDQMISGIATGETEDPAAAFNGQTLTYEGVACYVLRSTEATVPLRSIVEVYATQ